MALDRGEKTCFIAMPVTTTQAHADLFGDSEHWHHVIESLFVPAVGAAGFTPWRPVARGSHLIHAEIVRQLEQADMVLCDLSHNNPNVFFELGVRTSVNKPVALVRSDAETPIPFDVSGINTHTYDPSLKAWLIDSEVERLTTHLQEAESSCSGGNPLWRQFGMTITAQQPSSNETKEEAILSVMSRQIENLSMRVTDLTHRQIPGGEGRPGNAERPSFTTTVSDVTTIITMLAEEYDQAVDFEIDGKSGVLIRVSSSEPQTAQLFRQRVRRELSELGLKVTFQSASQTG